MVPAFDISETEIEYVISGEIPGIDCKDLEVTLTDGILSIKGEKKQESEVKKIEVKEKKSKKKIKAKKA